MKTDGRNKFAIKSFLGEYLDLKKDKDNELATVDSSNQDNIHQSKNLQSFLMMYLQAVPLSY